MKSESEDGKAHYGTVWRNAGGDGTVLIS